MKLKSFLVPLMLSGFLLSGCNPSSINDFAPNPNKPLPSKIVQRIKAKGMTVGSPVTMRIIKDEHLLEVWKQKTNGKYDLIAAYNICAWSGKLGQKKKEGDRQAPEGFYTIGTAQLNPKSKYFLAFDTGYPNAYDRSHGYTGSNLMVHGACSSSGCYSMTDESVEEIFAFARESLKGGQDKFLLQALPFRMTAEKMAFYANDPNYPFWQMIKEGYDHFELTRTPPKVDVCEKKYVFNRSAADGSSFSASAACPPSEVPQSLAIAYASYEKKYEAAFSTARAKFGDAPAPIVMGGKSRPLDKKWKPKVVSLPSTMAFAAPSGPRITAPLVDATPVQTEPAAKAIEEPIATPQTETANQAVAAPASAAPAISPAQTETVVPVPSDNPSKPAAVAAEVPAAPVTPPKKKRWWLLEK
jgi:murein L,D-transpeptidase YafK